MIIDTNNATIKKMNLSNKKRGGSFSWKKLPFNSRTKPRLTPPENTSDYGSCSSLSSDTNIECQSLCSDRDISDIELEPESIKGEINTRRTRTLQHRNVTVVIPEDNLSGCCRQDFHLEFIQDPQFLPSGDSRTIFVSDVVSLEPHGSRFYDDKPAIIYIPLTEKIGVGDKVICLCSNTPKRIPPHWKEMPKENYRFRNGRVIIRANHFSLFSVIVQRPYPEIRRVIQARIGDTLKVTQVEGVQVTFPPNVLLHDVTAFVRVLFDHESDNHHALASPVIMVGPHGCSFKARSKPVTVTLPIPHYKEIKSLFGHAKLSLWQSSTRENEPLSWERLEVDLAVDDSDDLCVVTFPVKHFSFFKLIWDVISSSLNGAKLGVAYFYPYSMMCQAWMEENKDTQKFGLEVICYRSDNKFPEAANYKYKVGGSWKPKLIRPGCIIIRLKSELFEGDTDAGEDETLTKLEPDFRGREFEKQFACRFKQDKPLVERGTFGKVILERQTKAGPNEPLFEFNLNKTGNETEPSPSMENNDRWSFVAITELAGSLHIMEDNNWKKLARHIGFTQNEIRSKLLYSPDPLLALVNLYQTRGGTPEEFVQSLYAVSRQIQLQETNDGASGGSSSGSSDRSGGGEQGGSRRWPSLNFTPRRWRDDQSDTETASASSRKRSNDSREYNSKASGSNKGPDEENPPPSSKKPKRRRFSEVSETMSSSEESTTINDLRSGRGISRDRKLSDTHMWRISEFMNVQAWRALGRTLGLEEGILLNIEHTHKGEGFRECAYQMLIQWKGRYPTLCTFKTLHHALTKENMNSVAKQLANINLAK